MLAALLRRASPTLLTAAVRPSRTKMATAVAPPVVAGVDRKEVWEEEGGGWRQSVRPAPVLDGGKRAPIDGAGGGGRRPRARRRARRRRPICRPPRAPQRQPALAHA